jgi:Cd2+/Zn2+-exporting ATPase
MPKNEKYCSNADITCSCCGNDLLEQKPPLWKRAPILIILSSAILFTIGYYVENITETIYISEILFLSVAITSGYSIFIGAWKGLKKFHFNMSLLITIAAAGAFLIGHGEEGAAVLFLFYLAEFLEDYAGERAQNSIKSLLKLAPETAQIIRNGKEIQIHSHKVKKDEIVKVRPGDKVPLDGVVVKGSSTVNQAPITGESIPVLKKRGDIVYAGTINIDGSFEIKITKEADDTILAKIIEMVKHSQEKKSKTESFIERFATYYTPLVILSAVLIAVIPPLISDLSLYDSFYRALVLLVVSCPCALAISTPVSMVSGITSATRNGVLIKGGEYMEEMKNVRAVVFDKTGTLTEGNLTVTDIICLNNYSELKILKVAASIENLSKHPISLAITTEAERKKLNIYDVENFKSIDGAGLMGEIKGINYRVGEKSIFKNLNIPIEKIDKYEFEGKTTVLVGNDEKIMGLICLKDKLRDSSYATVKFLKNNMIRTIMLTGDNEGTAKSVATELGLDEYYYGLLPEDKVKKIEQLVERWEHVAMVGDGVNDAPALARANIGIAMGTAGSDVAIETADISLMQDDLSKLKYFIKLSKKTMGVVQQNVAISILVKSSFAIMAVFGLITLWMAVGIGDMGLSLAVILNGLRVAR